MRLSLPAVRALLLHQQALLAPPRAPARKADVLKCIRRMHLLQIDTISVVARSPYFVLHSRLAQYEPRWLDELHSAGKLFEYWSHAMCWIPAEDWPLFGSLIHHGLRDGARHKYFDHARQWLGKHRKEVEHVRQRIRAEGPRRSADFVGEPRPDGKQGGGWWDWKTEKIALDYMFFLGELMIARRENFQRVYDLAERVRPRWDPQRDALLREEVYRQFIRNAALALGAATEPWLRDYYRMKQKTTQAAIAQLVQGGELLPVEIDGLRAPAYLHRDLALLANKAQAGKLVPTHTTLLSPFDPLVWDRRRLAELFCFDYTISVYTPSAMREHGYFVLPVLHRGRLIGRLDPKAHRKDGVFEVRAFHMEPGVNATDVAWDEVSAAIRACAEWHGMTEVRLTASSPAPLRRALA
jgi:uncharacterized protein YcaQ